MNLTQGRKTELNLRSEGVSVCKTSSCTNKNYGNRPVNSTNMRPQLEKAYNINGLPANYIKVCPHDHNDLSECIKDSIIKLLPQLKVGIPELDIPPLEPFELDKISFLSGSSSANIATNLTNLQIWGASNFQILKLSVSNRKKGKTFKFEVIIPHLYTEGNYELNTKILFLDLKGKGKFNANVSDYHFDCALKGDVVRRNDENYLSFERIQCKLFIGEKKIHLENLFADNPLVATATKGIIDDNTEALFTEIRPGLKDAIENKVTDMANQITTAFTYEELFP